MDTISSEIKKEIEQRVAVGGYASADDLLRDALRALDDAHDVAQALLEKELLKGLEGEDVEMTAADWDVIESEALKVLRAKQSQ